METGFECKLVWLKKFMLSLRWLKSTQPLHEDRVHSVLIRAMRALITLLRPSVNESGLYMQCTAEKRLHQWAHQAMCQGNIWFSVLKSPNYAHSGAVWESWQGLGLSYFPEEFSQGHEHLTPIQFCFLGFSRPFSPWSRGRGCGHLTDRDENGCGASSQRGVKVVLADSGPL